MTSQTIVLTELSGKDDADWGDGNWGSISVRPAIEFADHLQETDESPLIIISGRHTHGKANCSCAENLVALTKASPIKTVWFHRGEISSVDAMESSELLAFLSETSITGIHRDLFRAYSLGHAYTVPSDVHLRSIFRLVATGNGQRALEELESAHERRDSYLMRFLSRAELALFLDLQAVSLGILALDSFRDTFTILEPTVNLEKITQGLTTALKVGRPDPLSELNEVLAFWRKKLIYPDEVAK